MNIIKTFYSKESNGYCMAYHIVKIEEKPYMFDQIGEVKYKVISELQKVEKNEITRKIT